MHRKNTFQENNYELYERLSCSEPSSEPIQNRFLILSQPRTGSTFFCEVLNETKAIGIADEWFGPKQVSAYREFFSIPEDKFDFMSYLNFVISRSSRNNWFVCNSHINHIVYWRKRGIDLMKLQWNSVIYIKRRDKLRQAISLARAEQTRAWRSYDRPIGADKSTPASVLERLLWLYNLEKIYQANLKEHVVCEFAYEDFAFQKFQETFDHIGDLIDVPLNAKRPEHIKRQGETGENQDVQKFLHWLEDRQ